MMRALWFFIKVAIAVAAAVWLVNRPGEVSVVWFGYRVETSVGVLIVALAALVGLSILLYRLFQGVVRTPERIGRFRRSRRREHGYRALTEGFVAIAAGDPDQARRLASKAERLLGQPSLSLLLTAQAAQLDGDGKTAGRAFAGLLQRPDAAFLGARGLIADALRQGDNRRALRLTRRALALQPKSAWTLVTLFDLEVRAREWDRAEETLAAAVRHKAIGPDMARRHRAALRLARSTEAEHRGQPADALAHAQRAHEMLPDFAPAAVRAARLLARAGKNGRAARVVERSWRAAPHPDLAAAWGELAPPDPIGRYKWFERLQTFRPHAEGQIAAGEAALGAKLWGEARSHLVAALEGNPGARSRAYRLLARLEEEERNDLAASRDWLARGAEAPPEPAWTCSSCGVRTPFWQPTCEVCGSFDALEWRGPETPIQFPRVAEAHTTALTVPPILPAGPVDVTPRQASPTASA